eukprot:4589782-Pleurochrysis_carterae.AAC.3
MAAGSPSTPAASSRSQLQLLSSLPCSTMASLSASAFENADRQSSSAPVALAKWRTDVGGSRKSERACCSGSDARSLCMSCADAGEETKDRNEIAIRSRLARS